MLRCEAQFTFCVKCKVTAPYCTAQEKNCINVRPWLKSVYFLYLLCPWDNIDFFVATYTQTQTHTDNATENKLWSNPEQTVSPV